MNWDDLRVFLAVARGESLSVAAKTLRIDPATVGRRIARLEAELGAPLFAKSPRGYEITVDGERLVAHAEGAEAAAAGAAEQLSGRPGHLSGLVRIGAPDGCANFVLPQVCARIADRNPGLEIHIVALPRVGNLARREADMAITVSAPQSGRLTVQKICDYHLHLAAHPNYLAKAPPLTGARDLARHPVVGNIPDMLFDPELDYLSEREAGRVRLASNSVSVQLRLLGHGAGIGVVHDFALPFAPGLTRVLVDEVSLTRTFYLVRHLDDRRIERLARVGDALAGEMRSEVERLERSA